MTHLFDFFDIPKGGRPGPLRYGVPDKLRPILAQSSRWGRIKAQTVYAMSSKYAMALYELVQLRCNLDRCIEHFTVARFRELLGVPPETYERGNDLFRYVISPAVIEVNGLSDYGVQVDAERAHSRALVTAIVLGWWRKDAEEFRKAYQERQKAKQGRMARLKGNARNSDAPTPLLAVLS